MFHLLQTDPFLLLFHQYQFHINISYHLIFHLTCNTFIKFFGCIISHLLLSVIDRCCFYDDRQVTPWANWQCMCCNFIAKIFCVFFFESKSVILLVLIPVLKLDNHINLLSFLNTLYTEKCLYINNTNTS